MSQASSSQSFFFFVEALASCCALARAAAVSGAEKCKLVPFVSVPKSISGGVTYKWHHYFVSHKPHSKVKKKEILVLDVAKIDFNQQEHIAQQQTSFFIPVFSGFSLGSLGFFADAEPLGGFA